MKEWKVTCVRYDFLERELNDFSAGGWVVYQIDLSVSNDVTDYFNVILYREENSAIKPVLSFYPAID